MDKFKTKPINFLHKYGETMIKNGYDIHPVKYGEKGIFEKGWQKRNFVVDDLESYLNQQQTFGVSIITKNTPAVDIDVYDEAISRQLAEWIEVNYIFSELDEESLTRIGLAPKRLMLFRTNIPFSKLTSRSFIDDTGNENRVEILGVGQHFVAFNHHSKAQKNYEWLEGRSPQTTSVENLPILSKSEAEEIIAKFEQLALAQGWKSKSVNNTRTRSSASSLEIDDEEFIRNHDFEIINDQLKNPVREKCKEIYNEVKNAIEFLKNQGEVYTDRDLWIKILHGLACAKNTPLEKAFWGFYEQITTDMSKDGHLWHSCSPNASNWRVVTKLAKDLGWQKQQLVSLSNGFFTSVSDLKLTPISWLIKGYLEEDTLALLYGEPGTCKSFLAIDMALCIASGLPWHENNVAAGAVFYISGEGQRGFSRRTQAWRISNNISLGGLPLFFGKHAVTLMTKEAAEGVILQIDQIVATSSTTPKLIIIDTLHNCYSGNENDAGDMAKFLSTLSILKQKYNCSILIVHHSGKASPGTARGSSALKAGIDTEFNMLHKYGDLLLTNTKMKDSEPSPDKYFKRKVIDLTDDNDRVITDEDGININSLVLSECSAKLIKKPPSGKNQITVFDQFNKLNEQEFELGVSIDELLYLCCHSDDDKPKMKKKTFDQTLKNLIDKEYLKQIDNELHAI